MQDFPGNLLVNNFTAGVMSLIPDQGTKIPHAARCGKKKKKKPQSGHMYNWLTLLYTGNHKL